MTGNVIDEIPSRFSRCSPECDHFGVFATILLPGRRRKKSPAPFDSKLKIEDGIILSESPNNLSRRAIRIPPGSGLLKAGTVLGRLTSGPFYEEIGPIIAAPRFTFPFFVPSPTFACDGSFGSEWAAAVLLTEVDATECTCGEENSGDAGELSTYLETEPIFATVIMGAPSKVRRSALHFHASVKSEEEKQAKIAQLARFGKIEVMP
jgi:hypothetical protein